jgi:hypothetical protein
MRERTLEAILNCVFGVLTISGDPKGDPPDTPGMSFDEVTESGWVSHSNCCQKHRVFRARSDVPERSEPFWLLCFDLVFHTCPHLLPHSFARHASLWHRSR